MTPIVESWVSPADVSTSLSAYYAHIRTVEGAVTVSSSHHASIAEATIRIGCGCVSMMLDADVARALGQQLIAATDHYEQQLAEKTAPVKVA